MKKRIMACLLSVMMVFSVFPAIGALAETVTTVITDCDTLTGWTKTGGNALSAPGVAPRSQGSAGAIECDVNYGAFRTATYTLPESMDISQYDTVEWDAMFFASGDNPATGKMWDEVKAAYGTAGNNTLLLKLMSEGDDNNRAIWFLSGLEWSQPYANLNWVHFKAKISAPNTDVNFDRTKLKKFYFASCDGAVVSTVSNGQIRLDNIVAVKTETETPGPGEETGDDVLITDCDSLTGWTKTGGNVFNIGSSASNWNAPTEQYVYRHINYGAFRQSYYAFSAPLDISGYKSLKWNMYFGPSGLWETIRETYPETIYLKLFNTDSDNGARMLFPLDKLIVSPIEGYAGWYRFAVNFADGAARDGFDSTAVTRVSFVTNETSNLDINIESGVVGFDEVYLSKKAATASNQDGSGWPLITAEVDKTITGSNFVYENNAFEYDLSTHSKDGLWLVAKISVENQTNPGEVGGLVSDGQLELTSSGKSDVEEANWTVAKLNLKSGTNNLRLKLSDANYDNGLDLSSINYLRLYIRPADQDTYRIRITEMYLTDQKENSPLPTLFSDGMMFQQNKPMNLWGQVAAGDAVEAELYQQETLLASVQTTADEDGNWALAFPARAGGYTEYSIKVKVGGEIAKEISSVLVGELWISAGQSNMEYFLGQTIPGYDWSLIPTDRYVRIFVEPTVPGGVQGTLPVTPAYDIEGAYWTDGGAANNVKYVSAIAYYTCLKLRQALHVPVGFVNAAKGASVTEAWLSRESIDGSDVVRQKLIDRRIYKSESALHVPGNWNMMTSLYNTKLAPLAGMNIAGVMWYQGESNVKYAEDNGENPFYEAALKLIAEDWAGLFGFEEGEMPFVFAHITPYNYSNVRANDYDTVLPMLAESMSKAWAVHPDSMVQIPTYDLPLTYQDPPTRDYDPIHPSTKEPVGERFARAMLSRFYATGAAGYNAAVYKNMRIEGSKIIVTLDQTGTGLALRNGGTDAEGFLICGSDRVFVNAHAKITGPNTVEVSSPHVSMPVAAAYAFSSFNGNADLINSYGLPVVPFRTDTVASVFVGNQDWMNVDHSEVWVDSRSSNTAGWEAAWKADNGVTMTWDTAIKAQGTSSLKLVTGTANTGAGPILKYATINYRMAQYPFVSVLVKNPDNTVKTLKMKVGTKWSAAATVPANSDFTRITFDLSGIQASAFNAYTDYKFTVAEPGTVYLDDILLGTAAPCEERIEEAALGTTVAAFLAENGLAANTPVYRGESALSATDPIGTGCRAVAGTQIVFALVRLDLDGDGLAAASDLVMLRHWLIGADTLSDLALEAAKKTAQQETVTVADLVRLKKAAAD